MSGPAGDLATQIGAGVAFAWTSWQAWKANKQTKNTGNGFAKHVTDSLDRIEKKGDETHALMIEHLADHAGSDLSK